MDMTQNGPRLRWWARAVAAASLVFVQAMCVVPASAQLAIHRGARLKAGFLYNFALFVEWPVAAPAAARDMRICVIGRDPFEGQLDAMLDGKQVAGRNVSVVAVGRSDERNLAQCDIVFVSESAHDELRAILTKLRRRPVLTISDIPQFARVGGMIGLTCGGQTIGFEINRAVAEDAGVKFSAKLLTLATIVTTDPQTR
jgi:uncharacterized protein DUF4154